MSDDSPPQKPADAGAPAWVMTFADLMSLLMCFFVLLLAFSEMDGGFVCREHRRGLGVSPEAVVLVQRILGGQLGAALNEPASPATHEVEQLATRALEHFLERRMRSTSVLGH